MRGGGKRFAPGNPGKPKGSKCKRTLEGEAIARALIEGNIRLLERFLTSNDERVALDACKFFFEQAYGRARARVDIDLNGQIRFEDVSAAISEAAARARELK